MTITPVVILVNEKLTMNSRLCLFSIGLIKKQTTGSFFFSLKFLFLGLHDLTSAAGSSRECIDVLPRLWHYKC